ncbi:beta-galactosidase [Sphaerisporangium melleum]|uniref:Beta-galactosidase n=1 Tax=Sphaerisporangium melleum TaxID=321316 RepID=A0A917R1P4_9ACTN|nr:beta-galactosidase [Sphaerisporangium melleum]GGK84162.1 beta-galactosidase [Sphaerisporangium melleum]GII70371.1 beta-galactosidase [Sphaerisporangium melleum]
MEADHGHRWLRWPSSQARARLAFGADYNPEQWPREVWDEDMRAMRAAGVNIVSLAIFSWARIQPAQDVWDFGWLDDAMDLLHAHGIAVDLATATASPPPWLTTKHPEILPVDQNGHTVWPGARQHWRPTSPVFREHALRLTRALAERYGRHPALAAWHVSNELGCHNVYDFSDDAATAFRAWLRSRYGTLEELNRAWATAFWSQHYSDWAQILPPRLAASYPNPTQQLDFKRFSSDALKDHLRAERDVLREVTPDVPVTTNFMVMGGTKGMNYADWAGEVDFVSNDHYLLTGPQAQDELSFSANLTGSLAGARPWYLMEHSTSAVNWQPVNLAKKPGGMARDSLTHVAYGADAVCFFQWRQSAGGAEKYHSAMLPHAGEDSEVFRAVTELGATLAALAPVAGTRRSRAAAAIVFDWESWWASELDSHPTSLLRYRQEALDWYSAFLAAGVRVDIVSPADDFTGYQMLVAPILHVVPGALGRRLENYVASGGHLVTTYFSGIVDEDDHVWLGGYPGALRDVLGIRIQEFGPLPAGDAVDLDLGVAGTLWTDRIELTDTATEVLASYKTGDQAGRPAITVRRTKAGSASYVSTRLGPDGLSVVLPRLLDIGEVASDLPPEARGLVEVAVRTDETDDYWFLINRTDRHVDLSAVEGVPLQGPSLAADAILGPRQVRVLRRPRH